MCYHTSQKETGHKIAKVLQAPFPKQDEFQPIFHANGFAHPNLPVLSIDHGRSINLYNWGLIPFWVKDWTSAAKLRNQTLNARSEEVFDKPSFRDSIKSRRCIIPVTGFYEWKHVVIGGKEKIPFYIHPKEQPYFYLAGIYSNWTDPTTRDEYTTFSILTGAANELMASIHNSAKRQPLMISANNLDAWIGELPKASIIELMQPCDDRDMAAYTVSADIGKPKINTNTPNIMQEVIYEPI